jgi:hypothetical protein
MTLGNMRELGLALIFGLTLCAEVKAEVTYLTCAGTMQQSDVLQPAGSDTTEPSTLSVVIDADKKLVTVEEYAPVAMQDITATSVYFESSGTSLPRVGSGMLDRITGQLSVAILPARRIVQQFEGICKRARKLF